jgi:hypothetical protein
LASVETLRAPLQLAAATAQLVIPAETRDARLNERWQRIWRERRGSPGGLQQDAAAALAQPAWRALLAALDRRADALLLEESAPGTAEVWAALEPAPGVRACADVWFGELAGQGFGWFDWAAATPLSLAADQFIAAAHSLAGLPVWVESIGGRAHPRASGPAFQDTVRQRGPLACIEIYSPLYYSEGRLQPLAWLQKLRSQLTKSALPILCAPQLPRAEFAAAVTAAGGVWSGPFRAGAELPAAQMPASANPARVTLTLRRLSA